MRTAHRWGMVLGSLLGASILTSSAEAAIDGGKAMTKLGRGLVNLVSGWVEIPKRIAETARTYDSKLTGATWGTALGLGYGFVRTAAGAYELITFLFPAPPDYAPVIQPEFVFSDESSSAHSYQK